MTYIVYAYGSVYFILQSWSTVYPSSLKVNFAIAFFFNSEYDIFILEIALTAACTTTPTGQCADSNADCAGSVCTCNANFFKNKNTVCVAGKIIWKHH